MSRILITGSAQGLGRHAASSLLDDGHQVVVHARSHHRAADLSDLADRSAAVVVGNLADLKQTRSVADQVNQAAGLHVRSPTPKFIGLDRRQPSRAARSLLILLSCLGVEAANLPSRLILVLAARELIMVLPRLVDS